MPICVDCGKETPRDEMRGAPGDLRCPACVQKRYPIYEPPPRQQAHSQYTPLTSSLILAAVLCTLMSQSHPEITNHLRAYPSAIWEGHVWRLATTTLLHEGIFHLIFNVWFIWVFGRPVEAWLGSLLYGGLLLLCAAGPVGVEILFHPSVPVGLSGVGFALFGMHFALRHDKDFAAATMHPQTVMWVVGWFFLCIALTYTNVMPIANIVHGAGAVLGWLFGMAAVSQRRILSVAGACVVALLMSASCMYMPWNSDYAFNRAMRCSRAGDTAGTLYWMQRVGGSRAPELQEILNSERLRRAPIQIEIVPSESHE